MLCRPGASWNMAVDGVFIFGRLLHLPCVGGVTWRARKLIRQVRLRRLFRSSMTDEENLLYLLAKGDGPVRAVFFFPAGLSPETIRRQQEGRFTEGRPSVGIPASEILLQARSEAAELKHSVVGVEHLLLALLSYETPDSAFLRTAGITPASVRVLIKKGISFSTVRVGIPSVRRYSARARRNGD